MSFRRPTWFALILVAGFIVIRIAAVEHFPPFGKMLAQVGIAVGVAPNPYNTLDAQLNQKQQQLDAQQAALRAQQAALASTTASSAMIPAPIDWYLVAAVIVLALLIGLNFYLDWRKRRSEASAGGREGPQNAS